MGGGGGGVFKTCGFGTTEKLHLRGKDTQPRAYAAVLNMDILWEGIHSATISPNTRRLAGRGGGGRRQVNETFSQLDNIPLNAVRWSATGVERIFIINQRMFLEFIAFSCPAGAQVRDGR
jgi:hypothetical protein